MPWISLRRARRTSLPSSSFSFSWAGILMVVGVLRLSSALRCGPLRRGVFPQTSLAGPRRQLGSARGWNPFKDAARVDDDDDFARRKTRRKATRSDGPGPKLNPNRPPTLPAGTFRPKQSLGQNYLSDNNYCIKITDSLVCDSESGSRVVELGPGLGALTRLLVESYPEMLAIEIDGRAVDLLRDREPLLTEVLHSDVLAVDYTALAKLRGGRLSIIGNLPYYITSQILFSLADHHRAVRRACVTMQYEVAQRLIARPRTKEYGILSVVFQLYATPKIAFKIPPSVRF